jgi:dethiobiotin synthetase
VALAARVIVVVGLRLGCLNHALLTVAAVRADGLELGGWIANHLDPQFTQAAANVTTLAARIEAPLLGVLPHGEGDPDGNPGDHPHGVRAAASEFDDGICARLCLAG